MPELIGVVKMLQICSPMLYNNESASGVYVGCLGLGLTETRMQRSPVYNFRRHCMLGG